MSRSDELATNLAAVRARIAAACKQAGRSPDEVTLVAVTKTHPPSDVVRLAKLGVRDMAENRDKEAAAKIAELAGQAELDIVWHFVGQVQTKKARSVGSYADVVESVDRPRLVRALSEAADEAGRTVDVLIQVALGVAEGRGGVTPDGVLELAELAATAPGLRLAGLMAVAPLGDDPAPEFVRLAKVRKAVLKAHPDAGVLSAGMSGDLEQAIMYGSTQVRVGTALLGARSADVV